MSHGCRSRPDYGAKRQSGSQHTRQNVRAVGVFQSLVRQPVDSLPPTTERRKKPACSCTRASYSHPPRGRQFFARLPSRNSPRRNCLPPTTERRKEPACSCTRASYSDPPCGRQFFARLPSIEPTSLSRRSRAAGPDRGGTAFRWLQRGEPMRLVCCGPAD